MYKGDPSDAISSNQRSQVGRHMKGLWNENTWACVTYCEFLARVNLLPQAGYQENGEVDVFTSRLLS